MVLILSMFFNRKKSRYTEQVHMTLELLWHFIAHVWYRHLLIHYD